jgi:hypothetical protein
VQHTAISKKSNFWDIGWVELCVDLNNAARDKMSPNGLIYNAENSAIHFKYHDLSDSRQV